VLEQHEDAINSPLFRQHPAHADSPARPAIWYTFDLCLILPDVLPDAVLNTDIDLGSTSSSMATTWTALLSMSGSAPLLVAEVQLAVVALLVIVGQNRQIVLGLLHIQGNRR